MEITAIEPTTIDITMPATIHKATLYAGSIWTENGQVRPEHFYIFEAYDNGKVIASLELLPDGRLDLQGDMTEAARQFFAQVVGHLEQWLTGRP